MRILTLLLALALTGCAFNPVSGVPDVVFMTETQELELGADYDVLIRKNYGQYDDSAMQQYIDGIGQRLAKVSHRPDIKWKFTVIDSPDVNAFALPGGYVYVTRGIMAYFSTEDEIAAVLGHEIGHVTARHGVRAHSRGLLTQVSVSSVVKATPLLDNVLGRSAALGGAGALLAGYSRDFELDADQLGAEYLAKAGYDPKAMLRVLEVLKDQEVVERDRAKAEGREPRIYPGVFASHPKADDRLQEVIAASHKHVPAAGAGQQPATDRYLDVIDGMVWGDPADEGVLRGRHFYHQDLDFALTFPEKWSIENTRFALVARSPDSNATIIFTGRSLDRPETAKERLKAELNTKDLRSQRALTIPGGDGYTAVTKTKLLQRYTDIRVVSVVIGNKSYMFRGFTKDARREAYDPVFIDIATSMRKLGARDAQMASPLRLRVKPVAGSYASLASRSPLASYPEQTLRLINRQYPQGDPRPGARIKLIE
jgi:predicted Zn-dependent protease